MSLAQMLSLSSSDLGQQQRHVREIKNLRWAELCSCPFPPQKHEGARLEGLRFEKAVYKKLGGLHNPWIQYEDEKGDGYACPDIVLPEKGLIVECKLTYTPIADLQLSRLYLPLLQEVFKREDWRMLVACKRWAGMPKPLLPVFRGVPPIGEIGYWLV